MSHADILGYEPGGSFGATSVDQWAHDFAMTYADAWANDTLVGNPGGIFTNDFFASAGLPPLDPSLRGTGTAGATTYNQLHQLGMHIVNNWGSLTPQQRMGLSDPTGLSTAPSLGENDRDRIFRGHQADIDRDFTAGQNAADRANRMAIAQLQESGATDRTRMTTQSNEKIANLRATVDREAIASGERIAAEDRAESGRQFDLGLEESQRQFDLGLAEDRRQFNSTLLFNLLDRGIQLAQNPVDWLGYQYYLSNIDVPINAMTLSSAAATMGAVPPSGPSAAGPVVGGPGAMDGDTELAQAVGVEPGFVTVSQAIQQHPGGQTGFADAQPSAASRTIQQFGGAQQVDADLQQARVRELPQALPDSPTVQRMVQESQPAAPALDDGSARIAAATAPVPAPMGQREPALAPAPATTDQFDQRLAQAQAPAAAAQPTVTQSDNTVAGNRGVFTGADASGPMQQSAFGAAVTGSGAQAPQGERLLELIAAESGIDIETLREAIPVHLLAGGASKEEIMGSPVIQSLMNQGNTDMATFRVAPADTSKFGSLQAFGIPLNFRGGHDLNARQLLTGLQSNQEQLAGAIKATGQYLPDVQKQSLLTSPVTDLPVGAFGRRRFG